MHTNIEDISVIQEVLNKNPKAEKIFFEKYGKIIRDFLCWKYPKLKNSGDIDDYTSEILFKVYENLYKYNSEYDLKSWIRVIANNYVIGKWRGDKMKYVSLNDYKTDSTSNSISSLNYKTLSTKLDDFNSSINNSQAIMSDSMFSTYVTNNSCITQNMNEFETCDSINFITTHLSPEDYTMLNMKYVEGYNYCEIGKEFNLTSSTVSNKVNYIKAKLNKEHAEFFLE